MRFVEDERARHSAEKRALQRQVLDLQSAVLAQVKATGAQKDRADALAKKCADLEVQAASEPRVSRLGSSGHQLQPKQSDKQTQTDFREPVEARAPSVVLATPAARGAASRRAATQPKARPSKRALQALQPPRAPDCAVEVKIPMPVLLEIIKQHPELKSPIHAVISRRDLSDQTKMGEIMILARKAQEGKAPSGAGPSTASQSHHPTPQGEPQPQSEEMATEMDLF